MVSRLLWPGSSLNGKNSPKRQLTWPRIGPRAVLVSIKEYLLFPEADGRAFWFHNIRGSCVDLSVSPIRIEMILKPWTY